MFIARLIRPDTSLYHRLREKVKQLDTFFQIKPVIFFPVWIMSVAGVSAAEMVKTPNLIWLPNIDGTGVLFFLGLTLLIIASLITKNNNGKEIPVSLLKFDRTMITAIGFLLVFVISGVVSFQNTSIYPVLSLIWALGIYFLFKGGLHPGKSDEKVSLSKSALLYVAVGICLFMFGWNYAGGTLFTGLLHSIPYGLGYSAIGVIASLRTPIVTNETTPDQKIPYSHIGAHGILGTVFVIIAVFLGYRFGDPVISTSAIITLPFFLVLLIKPRMDHLDRTNYYPILILAIFVVVRYPWFLLPLLVLFHFCRFYYYFRFQVVYPTFSTHQ